MSKLDKILLAINQIAEARCLRLDFYKIYLHEHVIPRHIEHFGLWIVDFDMWLKCLATYNEMKQYQGISEVEVSGLGKVRFEVGITEEYSDSSSISVKLLLQDFRKKDSKKSKAS